MLLVTDNRQLTTCAKPTSETCRRTWQMWKPSRRPLEGAGKANFYATSKETQGKSGRETDRERTR